MGAEILDDRTLALRRILWHYQSGSAANRHSVTVPDPIRRHAALLSVAITLLAATSSQAQNLFPNADFDTGIVGWAEGQCNAALTPTWSGNDASGNPTSGALRLLNDALTDNGGFDTCRRCTNVSGPATYHLSGKARVPGGQAQQAIPVLIVSRFAAADCQGQPNATIFVGGTPAPTGNWRSLGNATITVPASGGSFFLSAALRKVGNGGEVVALFDELRLCRNGDCAASGGDGWLTSSEFPDFRFRVQFTPETGPFYGAKESDCLPDTLCVSSELPGRTAVLLRIIGPRPNGYLWFQATRFPAQQVDIEVQQLSTGIVKTYRLDRLDRDDTQIPGRLDRTAFLP
jgi:hypothetical protein